MMLCLFSPQSRSEPDIRSPGPELATFPENVNTLPAGNGYIEISAGYVGSSATEDGKVNTPFLLEYGLTDDIELRIYDNGFTWSDTNKTFRGFEPPTFGALIHVMDEQPEYFLPAIAFEPLVTTNLLGNSNTQGGIQPILQFTFVNTLPSDIEFNYTLGTFRNRNNLNQENWQFQFQWALQREFFWDDLALFIHGAYNTLTITPPENSAPSVVLTTGQSVIGGGFILTVSDRLALYGQISGGINTDSTAILSWAGFSFAF